MILRNRFSGSSLALLICYLRLAFEQNEYTKIVYKVLKGEYIKVREDEMVF